MEILNQKQNIDKIVYDIVKEIIEPCNQRKFQFKLSDLPKFEDWPKSSQFTESSPSFFKELQSFKKDSIYWFSCENAEDAKLLDKKLCFYRLNKGRKNYRVVPTSNKYVDKKNVLYVGVRRGSTAKNPKVSHIAERIFQHLGYSRQPKTQGLQLLHWAKDLPIKINLHVVHFNCAVGPLLYVIEKELSKKLMPHCGRH